MTVTDTNEWTLAELLSAIVSRSVAKDVDHVIVVKTDRMEDKGWRDEVYPAGSGKVLLIYHKTHGDAVEEVKKHLDEPTDVEGVTRIIAFWDSIPDMDVISRPPRYPKLLTWERKRPERVPHLKRGGYGRQQRPF